MFDANAFRVTLARLIALASGLPNGQIQLTKHGDLQPIGNKNAYCNVHLVRTTVLGSPYQRYTSAASATQITEEVTENSQFTVSLNFFREGAFQYANNLKGAAFRSAVASFLHTNDLGWFGLGPINDLTGWFVHDSEERAQVNLTLAAENVDATDINRALSVDTEVMDYTTAKIETFYAVDPQNGNELVAFDNEI